METTEEPLYLLPQKKSRAIIPKTITFLILETIFYLGVLLNIHLLEMTPAEETTVKLVALIFLLTTLVLALVLAIHRATLSYHFYRTYIAFNRITLPYSQITNTTLKQDLLDKIFHTYSIPINNTVILRHIPFEIQIESYLQKMKEYAQAAQSTSLSTSPALGNRR